MTFDNKICLVVGASSGMGRRTALHAGALGATVIAAARRKPACEAVVDEIKAAGGAGLALQVDGTDESSVAAAVDQIKTDFGRLDCVFNNLGDTVGHGPFVETPLERWQASLNVNLTSVFMLMKAQIPLLKAGGGGVIVNNSSTGGLKGVPQMADYAAAKWGLIGLTRSVAMEHGPDRIRCLAIAPGIIMTEKAQQIAERMPDLFEGLRKEIPLDMMGEMQDVAELVCWLMSDAAKYLSGVTIPIDGARTA